MTSSSPLTPALSLSPAAPPPGAPSSGAATTLSPNEVNQLANPQLFLQLLVAELQNQDPTNPMNPATILSQTASLSQMEAVNSMVSALTSGQQTSQAGEATDLMGQDVAATLNGASVSGKVTGVALSATAPPVLDVGGVAVPLADVTSVGVAPPPSSSPAPTTSTSTATSTTGATTTASSA